MLLKQQAAEMKNAHVAQLNVVNESDKPPKHLKGKELGLISYTRLLSRIIGYSCNILMIFQDYGIKKKLVD